MRRVGDFIESSRSTPEIDCCNFYNELKPTKLCSLITRRAGLRITRTHKAGTILIAESPNRALIAEARTIYLIDKIRVFNVLRDAAPERIKFLLHNLSLRPQQLAGCRVLLGEGGIVGVFLGVFLSGHLGGHWVGAG